MEDSEKQIHTLINSRTTYVRHVPKVFNKINDLIENCEHYKKLDCLQDQLMSLSEKIKGIHNQILELVQCPDQYQTCQEHYFNENSRIIVLVSKIQSYFEKFSENSSKSSKFKRSFSKLSSSNSKSSSIQFEKAKEQAHSNY